MLSFVIVFAFSMFFFMMLGIVFSSDNPEEIISVVIEKDFIEREEIFVEPITEPTRIVIASVGIDATILNPKSRDVAVLDDALKDGVVRYPGSGLLGEDTDMFLFGHSTNWEIVQNPAYQLFNNIELVQKGDFIRVQSGNREYVYSVASVKLVNADVAWVELAHQKKLIISTCNTFGKKSDRFVVEADFVTSYLLNVDDDNS